MATEAATQEKNARKKAQGATNIQERRIIDKRLVELYVDKRLTPEARQIIAKTRDRLKLPSFDSLDHARTYLTKNYSPPEPDLDTSAIKAREELQAKAAIAHGTQLTVQRAVDIGNAPTFTDSDAAAINDVLRNISPALRITVPKPGDTPIIARPPKAPR